MISRWSWLVVLSRIRLRFAGHYHWHRALRASSIANSRQMSSPGAGGGWIGCHYNDMRCHARKGRSTTLGSAVNMSVMDQDCATVLVKLASCRSVCAVAWNRAHIVRFRVRRYTKMWIGTISPISNHLEWTDIWKRLSSSSWALLERCVSSIIQAGIMQAGSPRGWPEWPEPNMIQTSKHGGERSRLRFRKRAQHGKCYNLH